jgi:hypothetical protein
VRIATRKIRRRALRQSRKRQTGQKYGESPTKTSRH